MTTNRIHHLVAVGLVVAVLLAATSGCASALAQGERAGAPPPVERVTRDLRSGAKSVIVFVSAGDKESFGRTATGSMEAGVDRIRSAKAP